MTAIEIAAKVRSGALSARAVTEASLAAIRAHDGRLNAFTDLTDARALAKADAIDASRSRGEALPPLAGVPFAVKNLFDVAGLLTRAGPALNPEDPPPPAHAPPVAKLDAAGAVL